MKNHRFRRESPRRLPTQRAHHGKSGLDELLAHSAQPAPEREETKRAARDATNQEARSKTNSQMHFVEPDPRRRASLK